MNNLDRAYLLASLFPEKLEELTNFIKKEADFFNTYRTQVEKAWTENIITVNHWYSFIENFERSYANNGTRLYRNKKTFRDQLFDGYDALFTIHALIHYSGQQQCSRELKYAIYMLFGTQPLITFNLNPEQ